MPKGYAIVPTIISADALRKHHTSFSPADYRQINIKNPNSSPLGQLVATPIKGGKEVGSKEYITTSTHFFIRTKCLSADSFLLDFESGGIVPIRPQVFKEQGLVSEDILISKDSNIGETCILNKDLPNFMISGGIRILKVLQHPFYVYAILKHDFFRQQLEFLTSRGATLKHAKAKFLDCIIPFPLQPNSEEVIEYVSVLVASILRKEEKIIENYRKINVIIRNELAQNQSSKSFSYALPRADELAKSNRLDAALYSEDYKRKMFAIQNYNNGSDNIYGWGFTLSRGQNLQVSAIGKSIYSESRKERCYELVLPTYLTVFGTVSKMMYLCNANELKCLEQGDIVFGAEGFEKGRSLVVTDDISRTITNIHGITLKTKDNDLVKSLYVRCFLNFLRAEGLIDKFAVGGNGGSLSIKYWEAIPIPKFSEDKKIEIASYYHNDGANNKLNGVTLRNFSAEDNSLTSQQGIIQLDRDIKKIKLKLENVVDDIIGSKPVSITFDFLANNA